MTVKPLFGSIVVDQGDAVSIGAQVLASDGSPINGAAVTITIYNPSGSKIVNSTAMTYLTVSNGTYRYAYTIPSTSGSYLYEVTAVSGSNTSYGAANFEVRTISTDLTTTKSVVQSEQTAQTAERAAQAAERASQASFRTDTTARLASIEGKVDTIITNLNTVDSNLDSVQSVVNDIRTAQQENDSALAGLETTVDSIRATQQADTTTAQIVQVKAQLDANALQLTKTQQTIGTMDLNFAKLLSVGDLSAEKIVDIQNKLADLQAVSAITRRIVEQTTVQPLVESYMKFNSVEIHFLITNPLASQQSVKFKEFLPAEAKPEHILDKSGLTVDFDAAAGVYYVSGDVTLGPKETITRKVEMKDIWQFSEEEIRAKKDQAGQLAPALDNTQYVSQATVLKNEIDSVLSIILISQKEGYSSPNDHIVAYRENKEQMTRVDSGLSKLKDLVVSSGGTSGLVGRLGGVQTFATWGIILAVVFGFGLLSVLIFAMWRHQTAFAASLLGLDKSLATAQPGGAVLTSSVTSALPNPVPAVSPPKIPDVLPTTVLPGEVIQDSKVAPTVPTEPSNPPLKTAKVAKTVEAAGPVDSKDEIFSVTTPVTVSKLATKKPTKSYPKKGKSKSNSQPVASDSPIIVDSKPKDT